MSKETGGSAFPWQEVLLDGNGNSWSNQREGMTLRDYFAIKSLPIAWDALDKGYFESDDHNADLAASAYQLADAMLAERSKS